MEKWKNNLIVLLTIITLVLVTLLVLIATGKLDLKKAIISDTEKNAEEKAKKNDVNYNNDDYNTSNGDLEKDILINDNGGNSNIKLTDNWRIDDEAMKYIILEDEKLTDEVTIKKVKLNNIDESLSSQFYKDQQAVIDNIHIYNDEYIKGGADYKLKAFINNHILSVVYLLEEKNAVGICGTKMAVTNIDLSNNKIITQEELLAKVGTSYLKLTEKQYDEELKSWKNSNQTIGSEIDYYEVTFKDFSTNKDKYVAIGAKKMPNIIYVYIEDNKVKFDNYTIHMGTLFHQVGKGGCFNWTTTILGDYK